MFMPLVSRFFPLSLALFALNITVEYKLCFRRFRRFRR